MEELGLPMAFGKQTAKPASLPPKPPPPTQTRGEPGQRGSRGVVGGSKRRRGRGGHIPYNASGANAQPVSSRGEGVNREPSENTGAGHGDTDNASTADELNPGVKRPPTSPEHHRGRGRGRGGRHGPHGHGGHSGGHGGHGGHGGGRGGGEDYTTKGYFQESFCEDPWHDLVRA